MSRYATRPTSKHHLSRILRDRQGQAVVARVAQILRKFVFSIESKLTNKNRIKKNVPEHANPKWSACSYPPKTFTPHAAAGHSFPACFSAHVGIVNRSTSEVGPKYGALARIQCDPCQLLKILVEHPLSRTAVVKDGMAIDVPAPRETSSGSHYTPQA